MARFKKRKSKPTPSTDINDRDGEEAEIQRDQIPPTESGSDIPRIPNPSVRPPPEPPLEPPVSEAEKSEKDRKLNLLFWMRVALAVAGGTIATFAFEDMVGEERRWASIAFMIIVFMGTIVVAKSMRMQLPSSDRKKIVTQAIGSYVFLYLFTWIVSYTLVNLESVQDAINL